jgi:hypothetical protein
MGGGVHPIACGGRPHCGCKIEFEGQEAKHQKPLGTIHLSDPEICPKNRSHPYPRRFVSGKPREPSPSVTAPRYRAFGIGRALCRSHTTGTAGYAAGKWGGRVRFVSKLAVSLLRGAISSNLSRAVSAVRLEFQSGEYPEVGGVLCGKFLLLPVLSSGSPRPKSQRPKARYSPVGSSSVRSQVALPSGVKSLTTVFYEQHAV